MLLAQQFSSFNETHVTAPHALQSMSRRNSFLSAKLSVSSSNMSLLQPGTISKTGTWENIVFLNKTWNTWNNQFLWDSLESCCAVTPSSWQNLLHQIVSDRTKKPLIRRMLTELDYVSFFFFIFPPTENMLSSRLLCAHLSSLHLSVKHRLRVVTHSPGAGLFFFIHPFILSIYSCFPLFFF